MTQVHLKYYDTQAFKPVPVKSKTFHSEFLRTGRIKRFEDRWLPASKRYYSPVEVGEITGKRLTATGERSHDRINNVHPSIKFPSMVYPRVIDSMPHLGYCHVTASRTKFERQKSEIFWSFYFTNFEADLGGTENFFENIDGSFSRMYFAVALQSADSKNLQINRSVFDNGIIFKTSDPRVALYNVLMMGANTDELRRFVKSL